MITARLSTVGMSQACFDCDVAQLVGKTRCVLECTGCNVRATLVGDFAAFERTCLWARLLRTMLPLNGVQA